MSCGQGGLGRVRALVDVDRACRSRRRRPCRGGPSRRSPARSCPSGPRSSGYGTGYCLRKSRALPSLSLESTPRNATCLPSFTPWRLEERELRAAGPAPRRPRVHHDRVAAQLRERALERVVPPGSSWLGWSWSAASGGGAPASLRSISAGGRPGARLRVVRSGLREPDHHHGDRPRDRRSAMRMAAHPVKRYAPSGAALPPILLRSRYWNGRRARRPRVGTQRHEPNRVRLAQLSSAIASAQ